MKLFSIHVSLSHHPHDDEKHRDIQKVQDHTLGCVEGS